MSRSRVPAEVLAEVARLVSLFGVANDAFDRRCFDEALRLREEGTAGLRAAIGRHPALLEIVPRLPVMLDQGLLTSTWPTVLAAVEKAAGER